jgi:phosphate transport system permease protein
VTQAGKRRVRKGSQGDAVFKTIVVGLSSLVLIVASVYFVMLAVGGSNALGRFGLGFLTSTTWDPYREVFGALPFIAGTLMTSLGALVIAVPLAIASALFITEYAPRWLSEPVAYLVELLAAIPSVVYGLWGIFVLVPVVRNFQLWFVTTTGLAWTPAGVGLLSATLVLSVMIIPFIAAISRDVIRLVPADQREAAYALGATKWEVIRYGILPYARAGILGGVILGLGRAIGETLAVTMTIGNANQFPRDPFSPAATMSSIIAANFNEAQNETFRSSLILIGLTLFVFSVVVNLLARVIIVRLTPQGTH